MIFKKEHLIPAIIMDISNKVSEPAYYERLAAIRDYCNIVLENEQRRSNKEQNNNRKNRVNRIR